VSTGGRFSDSGLVSLLADSDAYFGSTLFLKLWGANYTPASGFTNSDLGTITYLANVNPNAFGWAAASSPSVGVAGRLAAYPWVFDTSALGAPLTVYGYGLTDSSGSVPITFIDRFAAAPVVIAPGQYFFVLPAVYFANSDATPPVPDVIPTGLIASFGTLSSPAGWLLCDGTVYNIADYPALGAMLGATYGGNGTTTFGVPDCQCRAVGASGSAAGLTTRAVGATAGVETVTLGIGEIPAHDHPPKTGNRFYEANVPVAGLPIVGGAPGVIILTTATGMTGGGGAHQNMQPTIFVPHYIKT
jgi:microcystin-dependent protein